MLWQGSLPIWIFKSKEKTWKSFITSQFSSCLLPWMFHSRKLNNKINAIHERALRIAYCDKHSKFQQLLEKDNSVSIHHRNLQVLATEIFKLNMNLSPDLMNDIFLNRTNPYTLWRNDTFFIRQVSSEYHVTDCLPFLGTKFGN